MATRHITYYVKQPRPDDPGQFDEFYVTYDKSTEAEAIAEREELGYIDKFDVTSAQRKVIDDCGELEIVDGDLVINPKGMDPLVPIFDAEADKRAEEAARYQEWLQTPEGQIAQRYMFYQQYGVFPEEVDPDTELFRSVA